MKLAHKISYFMILILMISTSCSTTQKIQVSGRSGTKIYTPTGTALGTINNDGIAQITLPSDAYFAYLLSMDSESNEIVPFALDYKNHGYTGAKFAKGLGYTLSGIGLGTTLIGTIALVAAAAQGDDDNTELFGLISGAGAGIAGVGAAIGVPADSRLAQLDHDYQFKYLKTQRTNQDIQFTQPTFNRRPSEISNRVNGQSEQARATADHKDQSSVSTKKLSNKSTKTFSDFGAVIEGEYIGTGTLYLGQDVIERYSDIQVSISRVDKTTVEVNVIESDGNVFFSEGATYDIKKDKIGKYTLTHSDISKATIIINKKQASYRHPRVNIDGDIYILEISAQRAE